MRLIVAICACLLCYFSKAQSNPIAGRTFLLTEYDSATNTINLFNTPKGGVYMNFSEAVINYKIFNSYTSSYSQLKDSLYIKQPMSTLVAVGGFSGMLERLMCEKIWKPESVRKLAFSYQTDSLILVNGFGEKWFLVDSAAIHRRLEDRLVTRINPTLKEAFSFKGNSGKRLYVSTNGDTVIAENTWGKPYTQMTNYYSSSPVNVNLNFDTLRLGEAIFNRIRIDKRCDFITVLGVYEGDNSYLYINNSMIWGWSKNDPMALGMRFKYSNNQFEYLPSVNDSVESVVPTSAKVEYLKKKKMNGKAYKNIYVLSYELNRQTEASFVKKCYWASGIGPIEFEFMNGEKLFLINEVKEGK